MEIDLKWLLPLVTPFALAGVMMGVFVFVGAEITADIRLTIAVSSCFLGMLFGCAAAWGMSIEGIEWRVRVGRARDHGGDHG